MEIIDIGNWVLTIGRSPALSMLSGICIGMGIGCLVTIAVCFKGDDDNENGN